MSAKTQRKTGTCEPSAAGISSPAWAISDRSPAVFSATVLPPVFGPVITSTCTGGMTRTSTGTGELVAVTFSDWGTAITSASSAICA